MSRLLLIVVVMACAASASERASQAAEARQSRDSLLTMDVVRSLKTPISAGRLIYERPADLSYDSMRAKRPDLVSAAERRTR